VNLSVDGFKGFHLFPRGPALSVFAVKKVNPFASEIGRGEGQSEDQEHEELHGITVTNGEVMQR
jgi:hypothetical protein